MSGYQKQGMKAWVVMVGTATWFGLGFLMAPCWVLAANPQTHQPWSAGATMGFLANTPDDEAFALNFNAEAKMTQQFSIGPLLNWASRMTSLWWDFPGKGNTPSVWPS